LYDWPPETYSLDSGRHFEKSDIKVLASVERERAASFAELIPQRAHAILDNA
jgi:hypothetical protein